MTQEAYDKIAEGLNEALSTVTNDKAVSALPEKFEVFEQNILESGQKQRRRRSTPAAKPKDMPEPIATAVEKVKRPKMVETSWNGRPMWRCPECGDTTFKPQVVNIHVCARPREAKV